MDAELAAPKMEGAVCGATRAINVYLMKTFRAFMASSHQFVCRALLVPAFVLACHQFEWSPLRQYTTAAIFILSHAVGLPMSRTGPDLIALNGTSVQFVVACTMIDAFCGAIPLLWHPSVSVKSNLVRLLAILVVIFPLNIARLEIGFVAFAHGVPWWLAHETLSGLTYFCLLVFVVEQYTWTNRRDFDVILHASRSLPDSNYGTKSHGSSKLTPLPG
jgi:exosortase/archaeosortase